MKSLVTARLHLDAMTRSDARAFFAYRSLPEVTRFQNFAPRELADAHAFIARQPTEFGTPDTWFQLALRTKGALVGDLGIHFVDDKQAEFGITIAPQHQRKGYAVEALTGVLDHLFRTLHKHRVTASVDPRNHPSMALMHRLGMRQEALHLQSLWFREEWVDDAVFALLSSEWQHSS